MHNGEGRIAMPEDQAAPVLRPPRMRRAPLRPQPWILGIFAVGLVVSLATNIRQERKTRGLATDLAALQRKNDKQLADLREAQSALLEQSLLRLDQMANQLQKANQDDLHRAALLAGKVRSELGEMVEQKHQETVTAISGLKEDLRTEATARANQVSELQEADRDAAHTRAPDSLSAGSSDHSAAASAAPPSDPKSAEAQPPVAAGKKRGFWSKLNPFSRSRKSETGSELEQ
jgi:hypothetical protein